MPESDFLKVLQTEATTFRSSFRSVLLSTVSPQGQPEASYAPYISDKNGAIYIFTSELSAHTRNILSHPRAGLLFIENEENAKNIFARKRLSLQCAATEIQRQSDDFDLILKNMEAMFGNIIGLLKSLADFHLFRFDIINGNYVRGFGQAYILEGNNLKILGKRTG